jgi:transcriptional regulator with XRE-family HTH domain
MNAAEALRDARAGAGLTQAALAERTGTSQATISAYESGRKQPSLDTLNRLLGALGRRLTIEPAPAVATEPSRERQRHNGRVLAEVLTLAEALPARRHPKLRYPRLAA